MDKCYTPPEATRLIVPYLKSAGIKRIWEPAAGSGLMADTLRSEGFEVYESDIETGSGTDFLTYNPPFIYDAVVTNPPFAIDYKFVERAMNLGKPWAMLMKDNRSSVGRFRDALWTRLEDGTQVPPPELARIIPSSRISFKMPKQGWFTTDKNGRLINNAAQFATHWYAFNIIQSSAREICVPYQQSDRLWIRKQLERSIFSSSDADRAIDWATIIF